MASILRRQTHLRIPAGSEIVRYAPAIAAAIAVLVILAVYAETAASIVAIWARSETFAHGYVIVPISLWLAWRQRHQLSSTPARPFWFGLTAVAAAGALWLVMSIAEVNSLRQFALVAMLQSAIVTIAGLAVARVAAFPILFLLFAVPAGEFLLPTLMDWTADFTVAALRISGVPVYREANHFIIPSGAWSVVEACSGLRYLIASMVTGVVYAAVSYRTLSRRIAFICASIVVPLVANWLRAYMIVMIGHLSNNELAVGVDHLIYGWVFFGIVMALLFWVGSFWSEPEAGRPVGVSEARSGGARSDSRGFLGVTIAVLVVACAWRPALALLDDGPSRVSPKLVEVSTAGTFVPSASSLPSWTPAYGGHSATMSQAFVSNGAVAGLYIAYYRNQTKGRELATTGNQLVLARDFAWKEIGREAARVSFGDESAEAMRSVLSGPQVRLVAYRLYWIDGKVTASDYRFKAWLAWSKLRGKGDDAALVVFYAPERENRDVAREALEALMPQVLRMLAITNEAR